MNKNLTREVVVLSHHQINKAILVVAGIMFAVGMVTMLLFLELTGEIVH